ncbi:hypothetical protein ACSBR1_020531 [Camellia fascicularis]
MDSNARGENDNKGVQEPNPGANDVGKGRNGPKKGGRDEYYNESNMQAWKDRCLRRDKEMKDLVNKLTDLQTMVNFVMQNNVMQPSFPL